MNGSAGGWVLDESATLRLAQAGDGEAFAALVERYGQDVFRLAYLIVRDAAEAEDVAQEAFLRAYRALGRFHPDRPFRPWLLRIAGNVALNRVRSRTRLAAFLTRYRPARGGEAAPSPEAAALADERRRTLWRAIGRLRPEQQAVLYLRYFLDLSERDLAACLDCAPGTVKSRLHRALASLRRVVEREFPELAEAAGEVDVEP